MKKLFKGLIIFGIILIFGTAGLSDANSVAIQHIFKQIILAAGFICIGAIGLKIHDCIMQLRRNDNCLRIQTKKQKYYTC